MMNIDKTLIKKNGKTKANVNDFLNETNQFIYLFNCLKRIDKHRDELNKLSEDNHKYLNQLCINLSKTMIDLSDQQSVLEKSFIDLVYEYFDKSANGKCPHILNNPNLS